MLVEFDADPSIGFSNGTRVTHWNGKRSIVMTHISSVRPYLPGACMVTLAGENGAFVVKADYDRLCESLSKFLSEGDPRR